MTAPGEAARRLSRVDFEAALRAASCDGARLLEAALRERGVKSVVRAERVDGAVLRFGDEADAAREFGRADAAPRPVVAPVMAESADAVAAHVGAVVAGALRVALGEAE